MRNKKAFTLIELLVVVLIIAVLAAIALPKYMVARDRTHLAGLVTIANNVNNALDRRSLFDESINITALDRLDINLIDAAGTGCDTSNLDGDGLPGTCRIKTSGKEYGIYPILNSGSVGVNYTTFLSRTNNSFGMLIVYTKNSKETLNSGYNIRLDCDYVSINPSVNESRCVRLANSLGAVCIVGDADCRFDY